VRRHCGAWDVLPAAPRSRVPCAEPGERLSHDGVHGYIVYTSRDYHVPAVVASAHSPAARAGCAGGAAGTG
jgi:hypothetical protein